MADSKIKDLSEKTTGVASDEFVINDVAGGNVDKKMGMDGLRITESQVTDLGTYMTASSTNTLTNKTFNANGTGNSITNIENADISGTAAIAYSKLNLTSSVVATTDLTATGTKDSTTFLRGDDTWATPTATVAALNDITNVTITSNTAGEILKWSGSAWINNTLAEAGISATGHTHTESDITDLGSYITASSTDTLTNKTFDANGTGNSISNIENADISATAAIALSKLATDPLARANHTGTQAASTITGTAATISGTETLTNKTLTAPTITYTINAQTGTTYTTVLADAAKIITTNNASAVTVTIPPNTSVAYAIGSSITIISIGAGLTTVAQGSGVTINSTGATPTAPILRAQHSSATAIKTGTDTWQVVGDIS